MALKWDSSRFRLFGISTLNSVNKDGLDLRQFNRELVEYLRCLLLIKTGANEAIDLTAEDISELKALADKASLAQILKALKLFGQLEHSLDNYSTLPLELALVDCALTPEDKKSPVLKTEPEFSQPATAITPQKAQPQPKQTVAEPEPANVSVPPMPKVPITPLEPGGEVEQMKSNWKQIIEQAPENTKRTPTIAILRSAGVKPVAIEEDTVVLAFRYPYHKEQIEKRENQQITERIIGNFLGRSCRVRCIYEPEADHLLRAALKMGAQIIDVEGK